MLLAVKGRSVPCCCAIHTCSTADSRGRVVRAWGSAPRRQWRTPARCAARRPTSVMLPSWARNLRPRIWWKLPCSSGIAKRPAPSSACQ